MKRTPFVRNQPTAAVRPARIKPVATPLTRPVRYADPANDPGARLAKPEAHRNPFLLSMARGQRCLLQVAGVCNDDPSTTVACHSNWSEHGKAGARKADDQYHVYGCSACHRWLDQGPAPAGEKRERFMAAHSWIVLIWRDIVAGMVPATPKERAAARWALDRTRVQSSLG
ncbi:nuclease domain-containing protein [Variovorax sp. dw_954]|uniref:nuclease domain-containing protein n=1 Tax=Variovorax sp. dw_954 TaxID=2720078 RepID=UPI001BD3C469|nr:nuclease domain-containing protein [Variovorax sp. dw_954]